MNYRLLDRGVLEFLKFQHDCRKLLWLTVSTIYYDLPLLGRS